MFKRSLFVLAEVAFWIGAGVLLGSLLSSAMLSGRW